MGKEKVEVPICAMKAGQDTQQYVDLLIPCPAKLVLLQGEGPIHLVGSHCVDFYGYRDTGAGDDSEDEGTEDDADMEEAEDLVKDAKEAGEKKTSPSKEGEKKKTPEKDEGKKRKASEDQPRSAEKKQKESPAK